MTAYLILHKVRGEPAFDIAERCGMCKEPCQPQCGLWPGCQNEEWWIIPTSGHTAYPYQSWKLEDLRYRGSQYNIASFAIEVKPIPDNWPDHYSCDVGKEVKVSVGFILSKLLPKVHRRL